LRHGRKAGIDQRGLLLRRQGRCRLDGGDAGASAKYALFRETPLAFCVVGHRERESQTSYRKQDEDHRDQTSERMARSPLEQEQCKLVEREPHDVFESPRFLSCRSGEPLLGRRVPRKLLAIVVRVEPTGETCESGSAEVESPQRTCALLVRHLSFLLFHPTPRPPAEAAEIAADQDATLCGVEPSYEKDRSTERDTGRDDRRPPEPAGRCRWEREEIVEPRVADSAEDGRCNGPERGPHFLETLAQLIYFSAELRGGLLRINTGHARRADRDRRGRFFFARPCSLDFGLLAAGISEWMNARIQPPRLRTRLRAQDKIA
jgi:hypothetical protein